MKAKLGPWRIDWVTNRGERQGCVNSEWFRSKGLAVARQNQLQRGKIQSELFKEDSALGLIVEQRECKLHDVKYIGPCCPKCQDVAELKAKAKSMGFKLIKVV